MLSLLAKIILRGYSLIENFTWVWTFLYLMEVLVPELLRILLTTRMLDSNGSNGLHFTIKCKI